MTIKVYKVDRDGRVIQVVQAEAEVVPLQVPEPRHVFPACECEQCAGPS